MLTARRRPPSNRYVTEKGSRAGAIPRPFCAMNAEQYHAFTEQLTANLRADGRVVGLVALGSMARQSHHPDEWSDHDFFVVTEPGQQPAFRTDLRWLPNHEQIAVAFAETAHGLKIMYDDGHLLEFAVFDLTEVSMGRANDYLILHDRGGLTAAMSAIQSRERHFRDADYYAGMFLTHIWVGLGRYLRGEKFSGRVFVHHYAADDILNLFALLIPTPTPEILDNLDPLRRFEVAYPEIGADLNAALDRPFLAALPALVDVFEKHLSGRMAGYPARGVAALRGVFDRVLG